MKKAVQTFKAVADLTRLKMLKLLQGRELCVCELTAALELAQSTVSKHLSILEDAGLVAARKEGLFVNYSIAKSPDSVYAQSLLTTLTGWLEDERSVVALREKLRGIDRVALCATLKKRKEEL